MFVESRQAVGGQANRRRIGSEDFGSLVYSTDHIENCKKEKQSMKTSFWALDI